MRIKRVATMVGVALAVSTVAVALLACASGPPPVDVATQYLDAKGDRFAQQITGQSDALNLYPPFVDSLRNVALHDYNCQTHDAQSAGCAVHVAEGRAMAQDETGRMVETWNPVWYVVDFAVDKGQVVRVTSPTLNDAVLNILP